MKIILLVIFISLLIILNSAYNPIPQGSVIISTINKTYVMQPREYGGTDELKTIFTALPGMTIINTIYDPSVRNLYILFTNTTNGTIYLCQLASVEQLATTVYQLPISFNTANLNKLNSFSSDVVNRRIFLTDQTGTVKLFSMSGLLQTSISTPINSSNPVRSVAYTNVLNRLFIITDTTIDSCSNFDTNNLQCCQALSGGTAYRSIAFDQSSGDVYVYILDANTGVYQVILNSTGCPTDVHRINPLRTYSNLQLVVDHGLYVASGSVQDGQDGQDNVYLGPANGTQNPRPISVGSAIVALHISSLSTPLPLESEETCFHGITYSSYRTAVILAAIFGTIMGIFMCFNALFCIDFFMTKSIIRNLRQQIPHNLLEDRWNKLVEEKYAKIALEKQRKKDDPPSAPRRKSSTSGRKTSSAATTVNNENTQASGGTNDSLAVPNPIPKLSAYLRRKSESYLSRRRSDDYRSQRQQPRGEELTEVSRYSQRNPLTTAQIHIEPVEEEREVRHGIRQTLSRKELLKDDADFL